MMDYSWPGIPYYHITLYYNVISCRSKLPEYESRELQQGCRSTTAVEHHRS